MGFSHAANEAIIECYKNGIMTSVEIMPVTPWFPEVVKLCNENPNLDVGIHLALTSEWSNLKWRPLTNAPSISDEDGYFYPMIWPNNNYGESQALKPQEWKIEEIEKEIRAQIELSVKHIPRISHISGHMGFTGMDPKVGEVVKKLAKEYDIDIDPDDYGVKRMRFVGPKDTPENKINSFIKGLEELEPGNTYLFVEHPGYDTPELQAVISRASTHTASLPSRSVKSAARTLHVLSMRPRRCRCRRSPFAAVTPPCRSRNWERISSSTA